MATAFNTPANVQVAGTHNWLGLAGAYSTIVPTIDPSEAKVWGSQDFTGLMDILGGKNYISGISYRHFEEDRINQVINVTGTAGAAGASVTYTVVAGDIMASFPASAVEPYVATGTQVNLLPVRLNDILVFPNGTQAVVTVVTPAGPTFVATPTNNGVCPTMGATEEIINLGVSQGEGKDQPSSFNFRENVYYNFCEIMSDTFATSGTTLGEKLWVDYTWNGKTESKWWFKGCALTYKRMRNFREMKLVAGEKITAATAINAYDATLVRTEGLIPFCSSYNGTTTFNINTGLVLDDWNNIITDQLSKNGGATENSVWAAINVRNQIDGFIRPEMKEGGVQYGAFSGGKSQSVNFGFDSFQTLGYTNHLMTYQAFNNPAALGANGHAYQNLALIIPMSKDIYALGEKKEKTEVPSIRMNFVKQGSDNREWEEFLLGGTGGVYTNGNDSISINFRTHVGFEGFGSNRFASLQGETA